MFVFVFGFGLGLRLGLRVENQLYVQVHDNTYDQKEGAGRRTDEQTGRHIHLRNISASKTSVESMSPIKDKGKR